MTTHRKQEQQSSNAGVNISLLDFIEMDDQKQSEVHQKMLNVTPDGKLPRLKSQITVDGLDIPTINNISFEDSHDKSLIDSQEENQSPCY